jgi:tetratricopeptide (TPR) repeat protein
VRCAPGHVCISPEFEADGTARLVVAPEVLESDSRLRLALLEVWQRISDGGEMRGARPFARSTLRQLVSGELVGVADPILLREVLKAYRDYFEQVPAKERSGLPDPETYGLELGLFLVPVFLDDPAPGVLEESPNFAPLGLGPFAVGDCAKVSSYVHPGLPGGEGRQWYWRGFCAAERGDTEVAIVSLLRAERWLPHDTRIPLELGEVLCRAGYAEAGVQAFERAERMSPTGPRRADALRGVARCHLAQGNFEQAREAYAKALELDPEDVVTADWLRWLEGRLMPRDPLQQ